jgi:hypothetical protein
MGIRSHQLYSTAENITRKLLGNANRLTREVFSASGGTLIQDSNYSYHIFTTESDSFIANSNLTVDILLVGGGGGGGGRDVGCGGGSGGVVYYPNYSLSAGSYSIYVGNGGNAVDDSAPGTGNDGSHTTFNSPTQNSPWPATSLVALGGGAGGSWGTGGNPGGSSGGSSGPGGSVGTSYQASYPSPFGQPSDSATYGYGNNGQYIGSDSRPNYPGAGGGGAGGAATGATSSQSGNGGAGRAFPAFPAPVLAPAIPSPERSSWTSAVGPTGLFAGGGGGGGQDSPNSTGGPGGGGPGYGAGGGTTVSPGKNYTGSGGGAADSAGGAGGTGIVIIRYPGGVGSTYRYWRLYKTNGATGGPWHNEVQWTESGAGSYYQGTNYQNWSHSGLISFTAANVTNGDTSQNAFHTDSSGVGSYALLDLGAGNEKYFNKVEIWLSSTGVVATWNIQASNDNTNWTTLYTGLDVNSYTNVSVTW